MESYIIRFPSEESRNKFRHKVERSPELSTEDFGFAKFLPDVIVHRVAPRKSSKIKRMVGSEAEIFEDIQHKIAARG
jgi:hypothetical protein